VKNKNAKAAMYMRRLLDAVKDIRQALRKQTEVLRAENLTQDNRDNIPAEIRAEVRFDEQTGREARVERDRSFRVQNSTKRATWAAVAGAFIYASIAAWQGCEMRKATKAATSAATSAAQQLDLAERPWVKMDINLDGPLVIDKNGMTVGLRVLMQNTGHSPAVAILMQPRMMVKMGWPEAEMNSEREKLCGELKRQAIANEASLETFFPGNDPIPKLWKISVPKADLDKARSGGDSVVLPLIFSCVVYRPTFNNTFHETAYTSSVMTFDPMHPNLLGMGIRTEPELIINPDHLLISSETHTDY
jgi:hypothetical protein